MRVHGPLDDARRLPNTLSLGIRGLDAAAALEELADSLAASAGAACHAPGAGAGEGVSGDSGRGGGCSVDGSGVGSSGGRGGACVSAVLRAMAVRRPLRSIVSCISCLLVSVTDMLRHCLCRRSHGSPRPLCISLAVVAEFMPDACSAT